MCGRNFYIIFCKLSFFNLYQRIEIVNQNLNCLTDWKICIMISVIKIRLQMNKSVELQKFGLRTALPKISQMYNLVDDNRARLAPWFFWANKQMTGAPQVAFLFFLFFLMKTKYKKLLNVFDNSSKYYETFFIMVDNEIGGLAGLEDIDEKNKTAEGWGLLFRKYEGRGVSTDAMKLFEEYSIDSKNLTSLYAKTSAGNKLSELMLKRNGYEIKSIEYGVPVSRHNPKITDLTTWIKHLDTRSK